MDTMNLELAAAFLDEAIAEKQREVMTALGAYNRAVNAARAIDPEIKKVNLKIEISE